MWEQSHMFVFLSCCSDREEISAACLCSNSLFVRSPVTVATVAKVH